MHIAFAGIFLLLVLGFRALNDRSIIDTILVLAGYTYGPLLGLFWFGMWTRRALPQRLADRSGLRGRAGDLLRVAGGPGRASGRLSNPVGVARDQRSAYHGVAGADFQTRQPLRPRRKPPHPDAMTFHIFSITSANGAGSCKPKTGEKIAESGEAYHSEKECIDAISLVMGTTHKTPVKFLVPGMG